MSNCGLNAQNPVFRTPLLFVFSITFLCFLIYFLYEHLIRVKHGVRELTAKQYQCFSEISASSNDFQSDLLRPLLIQRVSGTFGNAQARQFILSKLGKLDMWDIELDTFDDRTPDGIIEFSNIVATLDPKATRRLVLACHYDSKKLPNFIGATDSAVPCAMLLDIAIGLQRQLSELKKTNGNPTLQLIFFDGEEAIRDWTSTDSLYGSRHLAKRMRSTNIQGQSTLNQIDAMDMLVLLDLIGDRSVQFTNFFDRTTGKYYNRLRDIETRLFQSYKGNAHKRTVFTPNVSPSYIEDDHVPFLNLDVPILHLISSPFPSTWHTAKDNEANLDFPSITHLRNVMKVFVMEYLHLNSQIC